MRTILDADPASSTVDDLAARIAGLGPGAASALFETMRERSGELSAFQREVVHGAALRIGRADFLSAFQAARPEDATPERGRAALELLAIVGQGRDLELVPALTGAPGGWTPELTAAFHAAFAAILARDEDALGGLERILRLLPDAALTAAIREVGAHATPAALAWLSEHLESTLDLPLLSAIERLPAPILLASSDAVRERVRRLLSGSDGQRLRKAALVSAALGDFEAIEPLIELVEHEDPCAREGAREALVRLSGLTLPAERARWEAWLAAERRWYEEQLPRRASELENGTAPVAMRALMQIGDHRFERHRLAQVVVRGLQRDEPGVHDLAIRTLERLGSACALPDLVHALEDPREEIAHLAWQALRSITGRDLPLEAAAWQAVL